MEEKQNKRTVRIFAMASFLNDMGSDMIYPVWPLFIRNVLGANMAVLGFIDGLGDALVSISQAVSGYISDKIKKRKIFIWIGYLCGALSRIGYALSKTWPSIIPFRILDRAGKMRGAPRDAIIADVSTNENRGRNFGILRAMDNLGAVCGILVCVLFLKFLGYRNLFLLAAIPSIIAALLILFFIKEKKRSDIKIYKGLSRTFLRDLIPHRKVRDLSLKDIDRDLKLFIFLSSIFALAAFSYSFLLIYAKEFGFKIAFIPVLYLTFTIVASISSLPFGKLSDKIGRKKVLILSYVLWGLVCVCFIISRNYFIVFLSFILYGLHKGALETVQRAFVSELAPSNFRASSLGAFQMIVGLCALPASLIAGMLWDKINIYTPFYFSLGLTILSSIMLVFVGEK